MTSRSTWLYWLSILLGIGIVFFVGSRVGFGEALEQVGRLSPVVLLPLFLVYSLSWIMRGLRLKFLTRDLGGRIGFPLALGTELVADMANQVIPARLGDVAKVAILRRRGVLDLVPGTFATFMIRFGDLAVVTLLMLACVPFLSAGSTTGLSGYMIAAGALVVLSAGAVFLLALKPRSFAGAVPARMPGLRRQVIRLGRLLRRNPRGILKLLGVSVLVWVFDILTLFVLLRAMGVNLSPMATGFVLLAANLTKAIPITPNGLGIYEGAMVVLLGVFSVPEPTAFAVAVLDHAYMNVQSLIMSTVALGLMGIRPGRLRDLVGRGNP
jgi:uncharacterized membrane protein YbhN (UPF0104 family)